MTRYWIKLFIEILDDPKMGRLPNHLWRRAVELFLLAGRQGCDGALPPVQEMAWSLRLSQDKVLEDLHSLAEVGVVHEAQPGGWVVTHFKERQTSESLERVRRYRQRNGNGAGNEEGNENEAGVASSSPSFSDSFLKEESENSQNFPASPAEALLHPDVRVYTAVTGGRLPGLSQYRPVIEAVRLLRAREQLEEAALAAWLKPYWLAWSTRRRLDGRPYDPGNLTWLTEWALNKSIPPLGGKPAGGGSAAAPSIDETRRMLAEKDRLLQSAVPPPEEVRHKIRGLTETLARKDKP
jgi:hypothetical protein